MRASAVLILAFAVGAPAHASDTINLSVMLIEAKKTDGEVHVDDALKPIADNLRRAYPEYQSFTLKAGDTQQADPGDTVSVDDQNNTRASATYKKRNNGEYVLSVQTWLKGRRVHRTVIRAASGQVGFLTTFLDKERNTALITAVLPVSAG